METISTLAIRSDDEHIQAKNSEVRTAHHNLDVKKVGTSLPSMKRWLTAIADQSTVSPKISPISIVMTTWNLIEGPGSK